MKRGVPARADPWTQLRAHTPARIALGRSGVSLPTAEWLQFGVAHAQARDAVHRPFDAAALASELGRLGFATIEVSSAAADRAVYLRRPDLGRRLDDDSRQRLDAAAIEATAGGSGAAARPDPASPRASHPARVVFVVGDGLSATGVHASAAALLRESRPLIEASGFAIGPVVLAHQARVALGDEIGERLGAAVVVVLIGERPGLSSPDSLGVYLTWAPRVGRVDAERNCLSNIRQAGLDVKAAAHKLAWLLDAARRLGATGVSLKDESGAAGTLPAGGAPAVGLAGAAGGA